MRKLSSYLMLLFVATVFVGFSSCEDDDGDGGEMMEQTIAEIVADDADFSILLEALQQAGLDDDLGQTGPFTVFAPTNQAFINAGIDLATISDEDLQEVLLYHVISGLDLTAGDRGTTIEEGQTYVSTASQNGAENTFLSILVERTGAAVVVNNAANVTTADVEASNGTIHIIDEVLMPLNVVGHAVANSQFTTLVGALGAADGGLVDVLNGDGPFTVFAPLNSAFADIQSTVDGLSTEQLSEVLLYHVVAGANVTSSELALGPVSTANGDTDFDVTSLDPAQITDDAGNVTDIVLFDVQATNGVIHVLGSVLIPDGL